VLPLVGRPAGAKRTQQGSRPRGFSSDITYYRDADAVTPAEGSTLAADNSEAAPGSPESLARGMLSRTSREPRRAAYLSRAAVWFHPTRTEPGPEGNEGVPGKRTDPRRGVPAAKGDRRRLERVGEQSYEPIVPTKAGNRRAPKGSGHGTRRREGANRSTYRRGATYTRHRTREDMSNGL
jgi:hypothetical protein